jgi:hypothetical protein
MSPTARPSVVIVRKRCCASRKRQADSEAQAGVADWQHLGKDGKYREYLASCQPICAFQEWAKRFGSKGQCSSLLSQRRAMAAGPGNPTPGPMCKPMGN